MIAAAGTSWEKNSTSAAPPNATKIGAPSRTAKITAARPIHRATGGRVSKAKPITAARTRPRTARARSRQPSARTTKITATPAKPAGITASAIQTGSHPPIRAGASSSAKTNCIPAQASPPATAVETSAT
jgi:hypothetical protein